MGYNFPMPFVNVICLPIAMFNLCVAIWFGCPGEWRSQPGFRKRLKSYVAYATIVFTTPYQEIFLDRIFVLLRHHEYKHGIQLQWIMSFIIPLARGVYGCVLPKVLNRAVGHENDAATFFMETTIGCSYAVYVTVRLAYADEYAGNWILGVEFFINLCYALRLTKNFKIWS